jgi:hypothetical protein
LKRLGALSQAVAGSAQSPPVRCWLPAEPGSGATTLLHQIAFAAAERGYPVLLLKQAVTEIDAWRLLGFLSELQRRAKALRDGRAGAQDGARDDEDPAEVPALLVLDTCHAGRTSIESLPDLLVRKSRRKVLTLWAMPVDEGRLVVPQGKRPSVWYGQHARGLHDIQPADDDVYLSALPAGVVEPEFNALRKHVVSLRERGVLIADRDEATWREFQRGQVFRAASHLETTDGDRDEIARFFRAEELFWVLLFHFLSAVGANPIAEAWGRRLESLLGAARWEDATPQRRRLIALLLEVAKTSNWGIVIPQSLLVGGMSRIL